MTVAIAPPAIRAEDSTAEVTLTANVVWKPLLFTCPATCVGYNKATLNGYLFLIGRRNLMTVNFGWDTVSHASDPSGYSNWTPPRVRYGSGFFSANINGLSPGTVCFFRAKATIGDVTSYGAELRFITPRCHWWPWPWCECFGK